MKLLPASWKGRILVLYLALLLVSHAVAALRVGEPRLDPADRVLAVARVADGRPAAGTTRIVYRDSAPEGADARPVVLLLHGSPGSLYDFVRFERGLGADVRVIAPDLPGFGKSRDPVPDYSIDAHALYALDLLERLGVERAHVLGFSMGGGVAIRMAARAPERVRSVTLFSSIGVQEHELFGSYELNRLVHAFQLGAFRAAQLLLPHFGALDRAFLGYGYVRNFYDTDQRPLRADLQRYGGPLLILHGPKDFLVPVEAALEHQRIVPQSELCLFDGGHFLVFGEHPALAEAFAAFVRRVEAGAATTREQADPERLVRAAAPFDPASVPPAAGLALLVLMLLIALATFVSEDLTCIGAGLLVADGRIGFVPGTLACIAGIFVGDVGVYLEGRFLGRPALEHPPLAWLVSRARLARAARWFERHGGKAVLASRFFPGTRLATYFAAGVARAPFGRFCLWFLIAALLWTPLLVGLALWAGVEARGVFAAFERHSLLVLAGLALGVLFVQRVLVRLVTHRGRRALLGGVRRWTRWEFWPVWLLYAPVAAYVAWLALRHRSLAVMTAANPAIPAGGFVGESKSAILAGLTGHPERVAQHVLMRAATSPDERRRAAAGFLAGRAFPVVLKPDVGQRGSGVWIVRDERELERRLDELAVDTLLQEYVPGVEFGLFYARRPDEPRGSLISITEKVRPVVVGDGQRRLEHLILDDERAVCLARTYCELNAERLDHVLAPGEELVIAELGTHCRGAIFLDGERVHTPALEEAVDRLSRSFEGFFFGRYDVRASSAEALAEGRFQVVELNGVTSESTHIYDPRHSLIGAWRTLFRQWRLAFEIGRANRERGATATRPRELLRQWLQYRRLQRGHSGPPVA